jgi:hypothetical protein
MICKIKEHNGCWGVENIDIKAKITGRVFKA